MKKYLFLILIISLCSPLTNIYGFILGLGGQQQAQLQQARDERLQAMINNINVINSLASKNITLAGDLDIAQPFQSSNVYQIRNLIDANNNWNAAAAGNCPETSCSNGRGCLQCFATARCSFDEADNTLICSRLMADFNYTHAAGWILQPNQNYRLTREANGNPILYDANGARVTPLDQTTMRQRQLANLEQQLDNTPKENFGERIRLHLQILPLQQQTDPASFASNLTSTLNTIQTLIPNPAPREWQIFARDWQDFASSINRTFGTFINFTQCLEREVNDILSQNNNKGMGMMGMGMCSRILRF